MVGDEGFEPPHGGVKVLCLTAWRIPKMGIKPAYCIKNFYKSKGVFGEMCSKCLIFSPSKFPTAR